MSKDAGKDADLVMGQSFVKEIRTHDFKERKKPETIMVDKNETNTKEHI